MSTSLFCNNLSVLDIAYLDPQRGLVGASYHVDLEFLGPADEDGIIIDFSIAKKQVKSLIDDICDHRFVLPRGLAQTNAENDSFSLEFSYGDQKQIFYSGPLQALCEIPGSDIYPGAISSYLESKLLEFFEDRFQKIHVFLRKETLPNDQAFLSYTHGLRNHFGNCQRLFHGHSNSVDIWVDNQRRHDLEHWLLSDLLKENIHFCFWDNVVNKDSILELFPNFSGWGSLNLPLVEIQYSSSQGTFRSILPGDLVYFMNQESTIENISAHFADLIASKLNGEHKIKVRAYEGISKGAITRV